MLSMIAAFVDAYPAHRHAVSQRSCLTQPRRNGTRSIYFVLELVFFEGAFFAAGLAWGGGLTARAFAKCLDPSNSWRSFAVWSAYANAKVAIAISNGRPFPR